MDEYELIYEALQEAIDNDEIDIEFAEAVNDLAYDKYMNENALGRYVDRREQLKKDYLDKSKNDPKEYKRDFYAKKYKDLLNSPNKKLYDKKALMRGMGQYRATHTGPNADLVYIRNHDPIGFVADYTNSRLLKDNPAKSYGTTAHGIAKSGYKNAGVAPDKPNKPKAPKKSLFKFKFK